MNFLKELWSELKELFYFILIMILSSILIIFNGNINQKIIGGMIFILGIIGFYLESKK